tara:strand:- start:12752 stop:12967 length:216 start_codon:yes stop_codon:yes gene_type:complete
MKLDDSVTMHIVKLIQIAMIQGIDITDYFRAIDLQEVNGKIYLDSEYEARHQKEIESLLESIPTNVTDQEL